MTKKQVAERDEVISEFSQVFDRFDLNKDGKLSSYEGIKTLNDILELGISEEVINNQVRRYIMYKQIHLFE